MLNFMELSAKNVGPYENFTLPLENGGLVFIYGKNGAGKSFIFEVLQHVLYGTSSRDLKKDNFVRDKNMFASLKFRHDNGPVIEIVQYRKHQSDLYRGVPFSGNGYLIFQGDENITPAGGLPAAEKLIQKLVILTEAEFNSYVYMSQNFKNLLLKGSPTERYHFISSLYKLDKYDLVLEKLKEKDKQVQTNMAQADKLEYALSVLKEELDPDADSYEKIIQDNNAGLALLTQELDSQRKIQTARVQKASLENELNTLQPKPESQLEYGSQYWLNKKQELLLTLDKINRQKPLEQELAQIGTFSLQDKQKTEADIAQLQKALSEYGLWYSKKEGYDRLMATLKALPDISEADIPEDKTAELNQVNNQIAVLEADINKISGILKLGHGDCPTCGQHLPDPAFLEKEMRDKARQRNELTIQAQKLTQHQTNRTSVYAALSHREKLERDIASLNFNPDFVVQDPNPALNEAHALYSKIIRSLFLQGQIDSTISSLDEASLQKEMADADAQYTWAVEYEDRQRKYNDIQARLTALASSIPANFQAKDLNSIQADINKIGAEIGALKEKQQAYKTRLQKIQELEVQIAQYAPDRETAPILKTLLEAYGSKGLKRLKISKIAQAISDNLNTIVKILFKDPSWRFLVPTDDGALDLLVERSYGTYNVKFLSGGEERRANLGLLLCLYRLASPARKTNLIILDEFTANVDQEGEDLMTQEILPILRQINIGTVFLLDNRQSVASTDVDHLLNVTFNGKYSEIKMV